MPRAFTIGGANGNDLPFVVPWTPISGSPFTAGISEANFTVPETGILILSSSNATNLAIRISKDGTAATTSDFRLQPSNTWIHIPVEKGWVVSFITSSGSVTFHAVMAKNVGE